MSITIAERAARLAPMPMFCAACGSQDPKTRYVDFDAAWDGPVVNPEDGIKMQIDDLVVCENCLKEASRLVGLVDPDQVSETLTRAQQDLIAKEHEIRDLQGYVSRLEAAVAAKPGARKPSPPKAKKGPQVAEVVPEQPKPATEPSEGVKIIRIDSES